MAVPPALPGKVSVRAKSTLIVLVLILAGVTAASAQQPQVRVISSSRVNIRLRPTTASPVITSIEPGTLLDSLGEESGWVLVRVPGENSGQTRTGYIRGDLVQPVAPAPTAAPSAPAAEPVRAVEPPPSVVQQVQPAQPIQPPPTQNPAPPAPPIQLEPKNQISFGPRGGLLLVGSQAGVLFGGGAGVRVDPRLEIGGDFHFGRVAAGSFVYGSGNGLILFKTSRPSLSPYAGGGVSFIGSGGRGFARPQILGGVEITTESGHVLRPEVRFILSEGETIALFQFAYILRAK